jgi:hypothetical protein
MRAESTEAIQKFGTMVKSPSGYPMRSPSFFTFSCLITDEIRFATTA